MKSRRKCVSVAAALKAEQGPWEPIKECIREIREQWAREGKSMPESGIESQWEPEWESQRAIESQGEIQYEPELSIWKACYEEEASLTSLAYQHIVSLQNN